MVNLVKYINPMRMLLDDDEITEENRTYLGFSGLGDTCYRKQWFGWRWATAKKVSKRMIRLWNRGKLEEPIIIADLESMGMVVSNREAEVVHSLVGKHCQGHIDGEVENVPQAPKTKHLLEMKTMAAKYWRPLLEEGVERSHPKIFAQMTIYMRYRKLLRGLLVATNKDNEKRIYERVNYDEQLGRDLHSRALDILSSESPPRGISTDPAFYLCKKAWCPHGSVCHHGAPPERNCRTCKNVDVCDDGVWECGITGKELSVKEQIAGCSEYKRLF